MLCLFRPVMMSQMIKTIHTVGRKTHYIKVGILKYDLSSNPRILQENFIPSWKLNVDCWITFTTLLHPTSFSENYNPIWHKNLTQRWYFWIYTFTNKKLSLFYYSSSSYSTSSTALRIYLPCFLILLKKVGHACYLYTSTDEKSEENR